MPRDLVEPPLVASAFTPRDVSEDHLLLETVSMRTLNQISRGHELGPFTPTIGCVHTDFAASGTIYAGRIWRVMPIPGWHVPKVVNILGLSETEQNVMAFGIEVDAIYRLRAHFFPTAKGF